MAFDKVKISKGGATSYVMRESLPVWEDLGWKESKETKEEQAENSKSNLPSGESEKK